MTGNGEQRRKYILHNVCGDGSERKRSRVKMREYVQESRKCVKKYKKCWVEFGIMSVWSKARLHQNHNSVTVTNSDGNTVNRLCRLIVVFVYVKIP